jgi:proton glutamate symport protein
VILAGTLAMFNLPLEAVAILLGVDTLMDMARTSVNVLGNCLASAVVARWEGYDLTPPAFIEGERHEARSSHI